MKTVKSALLGNKQLIDTNADVLMIQLKDIIKEHRALVIARLITDLPTYLQYKFELKTNNEQRAKIQSELLSLKDGNVDLKVYDNIVQQLLDRPVVHLTNQPFFKEIDECMSEYVAEREIKFN